MEDGPKEGLGFDACKNTLICTDIWYELTNSEYF